jgi:multicomponent Na+:H+ antiporter subunit F
MTMALLALTIVLLLTILAGLVRVVQGPTTADRMLAAQLFGTTAVGLLILLSVVMAMPRLLDIALVFAVLSAVATVSFVAPARPPKETSDDPR